MMSASDLSGGPPRGAAAAAAASSAGVRHGGHGGGSVLPVPRVVRPTVVTEKSLMESVAGFINEVQAINLHGGSSGGRDPKVNVTWARFETADINDPRLFPEGVAADVNGNSDPPLLLVLGYTQGVQVWLVPPSGEARELLSWKQGVVKTLRLLPAPETRFGFPDNYAHCRPLICLTDSTGPSAPFSAATFISLKSGEQVHHIKFNNEIVDLCANRHVVVATFREKLAVFDSCNFAARFHISFCYPTSPGAADPNPVALGDRWMAYADQRLLAVHRSLGGLETDSSQSMAAWGINVGSRLAQGVSRFYSNFFAGGASPSSSPSGRHHHHQQPSPTTPGSGGGGSGPGSASGPQRGVVTVLDLLDVPNAEGDELPLADRIAGVVAHFIAHNKAIAAMRFDSTGNLLLTCDSAGNYFNLFRIFPFPAGAAFSTVHHLYSLYRGDTPGSVQDIAFSSDNRLVAVSTLRGTTHVFPITPYGGPVGVRTHTAPRVVNRLSRFHRSAGIDEHRSTSATASSSGRNSPNPSLPGTSPVFGSFPSSFSKLSLGSGAGGAGGAGDDGGGPPLVVPYPTPYIPPFPTPTLLQPIAQLRQPYIVTLTNQTIGSASSVSRKKSINSPTADDPVSVKVAVAFAPPRAWLVGSQHHMFGGGRQQRRPHESLFVMSNHGVLLEYTLDVTPDSTLPKEKICESSPVELHVSAHGQWALTQPRDLAQLQPPLPIDSPLMLAEAAAANRLDNRRGGMLLHRHTPSYLDEDDVGGAGVGGGSGGGDEDRWLSQVEISTHVGPHRRLWMGPQFSFKTLQPADGGNESGQRIMDLDVALPSRPEQSNPVNMPPSMRPAGRVPVLIEASSASSFELSPRFSNPSSSSRHPGLHSTSSAPGSSSNQGTAQQQQPDLESELQEAMSETVVGEESQDGVSSLSSKRRGPRGGGGSRRYQQQTPDDEDFFCLTPEDCRSVGSSSRSRNASATSMTSGKAVPAAASASLPVQMELPDTKIFSVAVEARRGGGASGGAGGDDKMRVCSVDTSGKSGGFAVVSSKDSPPDERRREALAEALMEMDGGQEEGASSRSKNRHVSEPKLEAVPSSTATSESTLQTTLVTSSVSSNSKKSKKKSKKSKQQGSASFKCNSSSDEQASSSNAKSVNLMDLEVYKSKAKEVTPKPEEEEKPAKLELFPPLVPLRASTTAVPKEQAEATQAKVEVDTSENEEFVPARRGVPSTEEEEEEEDKSSSSPSFVIREPTEDEDEEGDVRPDASAARPPPMTGWLSDLLAKSDKSDEIIKGIASSEKRWEAKTTTTTSGEESSGGGSGGKAEMTSSTGFGVRGKTTTSAAEDKDGGNSSDDDFNFRPAFSTRKQQKRRQQLQQQQQQQSDEEAMRSRTGSFADSESSLPPCGGSSAGRNREDEEEKAKASSSLGAFGEAKEGWSFEADDLDVNRLIDEVVGKREEEERGEDPAAPAAAAEEEEKTPLEDVFKFDSEMALGKASRGSDGEEGEEEEDEEDEDNVSSRGKSLTKKKKKKSHSLEELNKGAEDSEDAGESAAAGEDKETAGDGKVDKKMATSLNVTFDEGSLVSRGGGGGGGMGSTSESSVASSPNPKKNSKGKRKKKRKGF